MFALGRSPCAGNVDDLYRTKGPHASFTKKCVELDFFLAYREKYSCSCHVQESAAAGMTAHDGGEWMDEELSVHMHCYFPMQKLGNDCMISLGGGDECTLYFCELVQLTEVEDRLTHLMALYSLYCRALSNRLVSHLMGNKKYCREAKTAEMERHTHNLCLRFPSLFIELINL